MIQSLHGKLNPGLPQEKQLSTQRRPFLPAYWTCIYGRNEKSAASEVQLCVMLKLGHSESRTDIPRRF
jgi:hypothetical protein